MTSDAVRTNTALLRILEQHPDIGIIGPTLIDRHGRLQSVGRRIRRSGETMPVHLRRSLVWPDYVPLDGLIVRPELREHFTWNTAELGSDYAAADLAQQCRRLGYQVAAAGDVELRLTDDPVVEDPAERRRHRLEYLKRWKGRH